MLKRERREYQIKIPYPGPRGALVALEIIARSYVGLEFIPLPDHVKDGQGTVRYSFEATEEELNTLVAHAFTVFTNVPGFTVLDVDNRVELFMAVGNFRARRTGDDR